jgi:hypothetical protein
LFNDRGVCDATVTLLKTAACDRPLPRLIANTSDDATAKPPRAIGRCRDDRERAMKKKKGSKKDRPRPIPSSLQRDETDDCSAALTLQQVLQ